jgi:peptidoglycan/LPS O-acetylase OafA/YrhL
MTTNTNNFYRADIDGLRAIAIISVVMFHMVPEYFAGGFAGVDIFFVISGYLISSIIMQQMEKKTFTFFDFYMKRVIRLFPSLLIVLVSSFLIGWFILLPTEFEQLGKHVAGGSGFLANIVLFKEVNYFNKASELKPLLHLWSLGIEEQFYFFWPVILFITWKIKPKFVPYLAIALIAYSFGINLNKIQKKPEFAFFMPQSRFWELFFGCLLGYFDFINMKLVHTKIQNTVGIVGFLTCLLSFAILDGSSQFPGYLALIPVIGTSLIIISGSDSFLSKTLLSHPFLVFIGLISYPLYLWHWPLLSFSHIMYNGPAPIFVRIWLVILASILASFTFKFIEKPLKGLNATIRFKLMSFFVIGVATIGIFGWLAYKKTIQPLASHQNLKRISDALNDWDFPGRLNPIFDELGNLLYSQGTNKRKVIFIGDSNVQQYYPRLEKNLEMNPNSLSIIFATGGGCMPLPDVKNDGKYSFCGSWIDNGYKAAIEDENIENVVIAAQWTKYFPANGGFYILKNKQKFYLSNQSAYSDVLNNLSTKIKALIKLNKKVYLILNTPVGEDFAPLSNLKRTLSFNPISYQEKRVLRKDFESKYISILSQIERIAISSGAKVINPLDYLCGKENDPCLISTKDGKPIYKDVSHLRPFFVRENITFLDETMTPWK